MKIDFSTGAGADGNAAAALALAAAIIKTLITSGRLSENEAAAIIAHAKSLPPPPHLGPGASARMALTAIHL